MLTLLGPGLGPFSSMNGRALTQNMLHGLLSLLFMAYIFNPYGMLVFPETTNPQMRSLVVSTGFHWLFCDSILFVDSKGLVKSSFANRHYFNYFHDASCDVNSKRSRKPTNGIISLL